jgi:hypothetical protein
MLDLCVRIDFARLLLFWPLFFWTSRRKVAEQILLSPIRCTLRLPAAGMACNILKPPTRRRRGIALGTATLAQEEFPNMVFDFEEAVNLVALTARLAPNAVCGGVTSFQERCD